MKNKRIVKEPKVLEKKVIEYFYNNPEANTSKEMEEVFNVSHRRIRNIMTKHLKDKLENSFAKRMASY
jgi:DNA-directed RNA polymerase sigma subunit (sigma70/sigma32)